MSDPHGYRINKKQFIAGAICPQCDVADRIVVEQALRDEDLNPADAQDQPQETEIYSRRRCVACDFEDPFTPLKEAPLSIPKGRVEKPHVVEVKASVVRLQDPIDISSPGSQKDGQDSIE